MPSSFLRMIRGNHWVHLAAFIGALALGLSTASLPAHANSLTITYYTISSSDPDANHLSFGTVDNEVQQFLGPDGLPVLNTPAYGCVSNCFSLASGPTNLTSSGEITYWSPALNSFVTETSTGTVTLPFNVPAFFFPPDGTGTSGNGGAAGYQAATLSGNLIVPDNTSETLSFTIGADDMAFAFLDGQVVCDLGGVHADSAGTCTTATVGSGSHSIEVFFVDINQSQSGFTFDVNTSNVVTTPTSTVPEPASLSLLGFGLLATKFSRFGKRRG